MLRLCLLAGLMALAGCSGAASDGYRYEGSEFERSGVTVTIVTHADLADLRRAAAARHIDPGPGRKIMAFSTVALDRPTCTMHIVDPSRSYGPQWIGHELVHCIRGRWHA